MHYCELYYYVLFVTSAVITISHIVCAHINSRLSEGSQDVSVALAELEFEKSVFHGILAITTLILLWKTERPNIPRCSMSCLSQQDKWSRTSSINLLPNWVEQIKS